MQISTQNLKLVMDDEAFAAIRKRGWILTRSLKCANPFELEKEDIVLGDMAHSLEKLVRYTGHGRFFYSVAEHSVILSRAIEKLGEKLGWDAPTTRTASLQALVHDGNEIYFNDITAPVGMQPECELLKAAKHAADKIIFAAFGLPEEKHPAIEIYDKLICEFEAPQLFGRIPAEWKFVATADELAVFEGIKLEGWMPNGEGAEKFLARASEIGLGLPNQNI